ncbi:MAG: HAD-IA family hydrolase [Myxococcota bacterium]|jgi:phosphoglycolate phosphatase|nr:HAD-IA family hydrolase [Myxococcota bacterium]
MTRPISEPRSGPLVVFDFDGTLADTWRDLAAALNRTLAEDGLPTFDGPEVKRWVGHGVLPLLARAVPDAEPTRLERLRTRFFAHYEAGCLATTRLYDGIEACLAACAGADLAIASNKPATFLVPMVERLGIARHFAAVLGGDSLPVRKPDPRVIEAVAARVRSSRRRLHETIWMVGDSAVDIETGRAAGARTIGCAWGLRGRDELREAACEFLIEDPREIPALLGFAP